MSEIRLKTAAEYGKMTTEEIDAEIVERHMIHAGVCSCLNDSALCCRAACPCKFKAHLDAAAYAIMENVLYELESAVANHGAQLDVPMFGLPVDKIIAPGDDARRSCQISFDTGRGSWADILLEEVAEAMDEKTDEEALRAELVQAAAMCVGMVRALDYQAVMAENLKAVEA